MPNQYIRKYKLTISSPKYEVYEYGWYPFNADGSIGQREVKAFPTQSWERSFEDPLRIQFDIVSTIQLEANLGEITLWNLNPQTEAALITEGSEVTLEAGYEDNMGIIFKGQVIQPMRGKVNGTDYYLKLICLDGDSYLNYAFSSGTFNPGLTRRQVALQVIRQALIQPDGVEIEDLPELNTVDGSTPVLERPKTVFGPVKDILKNIAKTGNTSPYVDKGILKFFDPAKEPTEAHLYNVETGLIGQPRQVDKGVELTVLLNPNLHLGEFVKLDNKSILQNRLGLFDIPYLLDFDGLYRIIEIRYSGDSRGNDWYCHLKTITQAGVIPVVTASKIGNYIV